MKTRHHVNLPGHRKGFSLIELAIGLAILSLAAVGLIASLSKQSEQRKFVQTRHTLEESRQALIAFASTNGRLPCPATSVTRGQEAIASTVGSVVTCSVQAGLLPAVTLGLHGVDANGLRIDAWNDGAGVNDGSFRRALHYGVTSLAAPVQDALTSPALGAPGSSNRRLDVQASLTAGQGIFICRSATGISAGPNRCGSQANTLSNSAIAVIWSLGLNANDPSRFSGDERQNLTQAVPRVYINRPTAPRDANGGEFDDLITWISYPVLADRLMVSGFVR